MVFPHMEIDQLQSVFQQLAQGHGCVMNAQFTARVRHAIERERWIRGKRFANARTVRTLLEATLQKQALRLAALAKTRFTRAIAVNPFHITAMASQQIDLHGLDVDEALKTFVSHCNKLFAGGYRGDVDVIHGYGSSGRGGVITSRLKGFLAGHAEYFALTEWAGGNPGVTTLRQLKLLPADKTGGIEQQVLYSLRTPKAEAKILARFHFRPAVEVRKILRDLRREGRIQEVTRNATKAWSAVARSRD